MAESEPQRTDGQPDTDPRVAQARDAAWRLYRDDRADDGARMSRQALADLGDHGELWFVHGCCLERGGRLIDADRAFRRARRAKRFPVGLPCRVAWPRFQRAVDRAAGMLPAKLKSALAETTLILADYAEPVLLEGFAEPELLGLFDGPERGERHDARGPSPRIYLWRRAHEHVVSAVRDFDDEVRQTLWHELGHYLGYDEDELDELGRG